MGVKGLTSFLARDQPTAASGDAADAGGSITVPEKVIVDASGFVIDFIVDLVVNEQLRSEIPSDYATIGSFFRAYLESISVHQSLEFYFDGSKTKFPAKREKRERRIREAWDSCWKAIHSSQASSGYYRDLVQGKAQYVLPVLMIDELKAVLRDLQITMVQCEYEADQPIAKRCAELNMDKARGNESAMVIGNDSDFVAMKGIVYSWLVDVKREPHNSPDRKQSGSTSFVLASRRCWRRKDVSESLGFPTELDFVDYCVLAGNDFTELHKRSQFDDLFPTMSPAQVQKALEEDDLAYLFDESGNDNDEGGSKKTKKKMGVSKTMRKWMAGNVGLADLRDVMVMRSRLLKSKVRLSSRQSKPLQYAIDFSYAMYDLQDIDDSSKWPDHKEAKDDMEDIYTSYGEPGEGVTVVAGADVSAGAEAALAALVDSDSESDSDTEAQQQQKRQQQLQQQQRARSAQAEVSGTQMSLTKEQHRHLERWSHRQAELGGRVNLQADMVAYLKEAIRKDGVFGGVDGDINEVHLRALEITFKLLPFVALLYDKGELGHASPVSKVQSCWARYEDCEYEHEHCYSRVLDDLRFLSEEREDSFLEEYIALLDEEEDLDTARYGGDVVHGYTQHVKGAIDAITPLACHMAPSGSLETGHDWENAVKAFTDLTASYPVDLPGQPGLSELAMGVYSSYAFGQDWDGTVNDCIAKYDPAYARDVGAYLCEALRGLTRLQETKVGTELDSAGLGPLPGDLSWHTLRAGVLIERIIRALLRVKDHTLHRKEGFSYTYDPDEYRPSNCFHASLFHTVVAQLEQEGYGRDHAGNLTPIYDDFLMNSSYDKKVEETRQQGAVAAIAAAAGSTGKAAALLSAIGAGAGDGSAAPPPAPAPVPAPPPAVVLPIHGHKERIMNRIYADRVTVIHGETGCGKSSGLPVMLLDEAEERGEPCFMMVSQPRRIAAASLAERLRTTHGDKIGLRMGHGLKDEVAGEAAVVFVTTGYLVRLLAHHPEYFRKHTHLIIDEVHERSVDGDVLCMLARRLLHRYPHIKLILMSATIHTSLYTDYFSAEANDGINFGSLECLHVGARRFPIDIFHLDDMLHRKLPGRASLSPKAMDAAKKLNGVLGKSSGNYDADVPFDTAKFQYNLVEGLVMSAVPQGTGCLIFVSGINDITDLMNIFDGNEDLLLVPIHSDVPYEEQRLAMVQTPPDKIKVIIATNAAESSITVPDCDTVICLGTHKALKYIPRTHRVALVNSWISQASATQRGGRTGRVRPGKVFRLYDKRLYEGFDSHEPCEVQRVPGQDLILQMRSMFEEADDFEGVVPILESLLQPPETSNIERSFQVLHQHRMITECGDEGNLTDMGRLAGALPVDLALGRMISMGILLGVGAEMAVIAIALSLPKTVFRQASPHVHKNPDELNFILRHTFLGAKVLDDGTYSEPIMLLRLYLLYGQDGMRTASFEKRLLWCERYGLVGARVKQFVSESDNILSRLREALLEQKLRLSGGLFSSKRKKGGAGRSAEDAGPFSQYQASVLQRMYPDAALGRAPLNRLRLVLFWTFEENTVRLSGLGLPPPHKPSMTSLTTQPMSASLTAGHLDSLLGASRYPHLPELASGIEVQEVSRIDWQGKVTNERFRGSHGSVEGATHDVLSRMLLEVPSRVLTGGGAKKEEDDGEEKEESTQAAAAAAALKRRPAVIIIDTTKREDLAGSPYPASIRVLWNRGQVQQELQQAKVQPERIFEEREGGEQINLTYETKLRRVSASASPLLGWVEGEKAVDAAALGYSEYIIAPAEVSKRARRNFQSWFESAQCDALSRAMFIMPDKISAEGILRLNRVEYNTESVQAIFHTSTWSATDKVNAKQRIAEKMPRVHDSQRGVSTVRFPATATYDSAYLERGAGDGAEGLECDVVGIVDSSLPSRVLLGCQMASVEKKKNAKSVSMWRDPPENGRAMNFEKLPKSRVPFRTPRDLADAEEAAAAKSGATGGGGGKKGGKEKAVPALVVGSPEWQALKDANDGSYDAEMDGDGARIAVFFRFNTVSQDMPKMTSATRREEQCILPGSSFYGSVSSLPGELPGSRSKEESVHKPWDGFYAVAGHAMDVGKNQDFVFTDKLTYLPPGNLWITLAEMSSTADEFRCSMYRDRMTGRFPPAFRHRYTNSGQDDYFDDDDLYDSEDSDPYAMQETVEESFDPCMEFLLGPAHADDRAAHREAYEKAISGGDGSLEGARVVDGGTLHVLKSRFASAFASGRGSSAGGKSKGGKGKGKGKGKGAGDAKQAIVELYGVRSRRLSRLELLCSVLAGMLDKLLSSGVGIRPSSMLVEYTDWLFSRWTDVPASAGPIVLRRPDGRIVTPVKTGEGEQQSVSFEVVPVPASPVREQVTTFMEGVVRMFYDLSTDSESYSAQEESDNLVGVTIDYLVQKINMERAAEDERAGSEALAQAQTHAHAAPAKKSSSSKLQGRMMAAKQKSFDNAADVAKEGGSGTASSSAPASAKRANAPPAMPALPSVATSNKASAPAPDASKGSWVCKGKGCTAPPYATWRECCIHLMAGGCMGMHDDKDGVALRDACRVVEGGKKKYVCADCGHVVHAKKKGKGGGWNEMVAHLTESGHMDEYVSVIMNSSRQRTCFKAAGQGAGAAKAKGGKSKGKDAPLAAAAPAPVTAPTIAGAGAGASVEPEKKKKKKKSKKKDKDAAAAGGGGGGSVGEDTDGNDELFALSSAAESLLLDSDSD